MFSLFLMDKIEVLMHCAVRLSLIQRNVVSMSQHDILFSKFYMHSRL